MKANRRSRAPIALAAAALAMFTASCSGNRVIPAATPMPAPRPALAPRPLAPPRTAPPPAALDWRDAPITPGDWSWSMAGGQSVARFAGGMLTLRCDRASGTVALLRAGGAAGSEPMTVTTTSGVRTLSATPESAPGPVLAVRLRANDTLLDAMTFSRGRFMVQVPGLPPLYAPSWPEVGRVVEDCR
jgi:hypothetical protein